MPEDGSIVIASPNFPDLAYRVNQNCEWRFQSAPGRKLTMQFLEFKTQRYADVVSAGFGDEPAFDWSVFKCYGPILSANRRLCTNSSKT